MVCGHPLTSSIDRGLQVVERQLAHAEQYLLDCELTEDELLEYLKDPPPSCRTTR
jgi:hypothetical protein